MKKIINILLVFHIFVFSVFAEDVSLIPKDSGNYAKLAQAFKTGDFQVADINLYIVYLIDQLSIISVTACLIFILYGGFKYVTTFGADDKGKAAKKTIENAIIGFVISSLAWVIVEIVLRFVSFN